jgi:hypothetical protein
MTILRARTGFAVFAGVLLLVPIALVACSSDSSSPTPSGDAAVAEASPGSDTSTVDGGGGTDTSTPGDSGGGCTTATNGGALIPETAGVGTRPAAAGGTLLDGTYNLTKHEVYSPGTPDSNMRKRTWVFAGNTFQAINNDTGKPEVKLSGTKAENGTQVTLTVTCPMSVTATINFTACSRNSDVALHNT